MMGNEIWMWPSMSYGIRHLSAETVSESQKKQGLDI